MFGSAALEVAMGLLVVYLMLSLVSSAVTEQINQYLGLRANHLWESICALLADRTGSGIAAELYNHQLIRGLSVAQGTPNGKEEEHPADRPMPSSIPADVFALALHDIWKSHRSLAARAKGGALAELKTALDPLYSAARKTKEEPVRAIATWYERAMERSIGWYKRKTQFTLFLVAFIMVTATNSDSIMIADLLSQSPDLRSRITASAREVTAEGVLPTNASSSLNEFGFLGWSASSPGQESSVSDRLRSVPGDLPSLILKIFGLTVTAYLATLGAPFWFDLLKRVSRARAVLPLSLLGTSSSQEATADTTNTKPMPKNNGDQS